MKFVSRLLSGLAGALLLSAGPAARLERAIDNNETFVLQGHMHPLLRAAQDLGEANAWLALPNLELHFKMTAAQAADLDQLLRRQRERGNANYHQWLTPEEFGARFGVQESDLAKVKQWLESAGFANVEAAPSRTFVRMSGTAAHVNNLFGAAIHQYSRGATRFYANAREPALPQALAGLVSGLKGLTDYRARPLIRHRVNPQISIGINGNHFLAPNDLAAIYDVSTLYKQGTDGTGQTIAVVGQSDINLSDIEAFQLAAGLPIKDPVIVMAGVDPGKDADNMSEADLDLEWTGGVARGATILYVNSPNALDSAVYAIQNNLAPVVSISYSLCEAAASAAELASYNAAFKQANAQGITVIASSGDTGAAGCDVDQDASGTPETAASLGLAVNFPASSPYVTAVGGTEFDDAQGTYWDPNGNAISYIPEIAWNDTAILKVLAGTGGGASAQFSKPDWQAGTGVPADGARDVPDIAMSASPVHDAFLICALGSCSNGFTPPVSQIYFVGGTSCAAPVFAGMLALLNQSTHGRQGNVNPALYTLASFGSGVFHDIILGDNRVPCVTGSVNCVKGSMGFSAGLGYDQVTGLGSLDGLQLIEQWGADFQLSLNPVFLKLNSGQAGSTTIQVNRFANFSGSVTFSCSADSTLSNTTCAVTGPVSGSGTAVLTVTNISTAKVGPWPRFWRGTPSSPVLLLTAGAGFLFWFGRRRAITLAGAAAVCLLLAASCGSGSSGGAAGGSVSHVLTGNVTVTASSGVLQHVVTVLVTIS